MQNTTITPGNDLIEVRDIIEAIETTQTEIADKPASATPARTYEDLKKLTDLLRDLEGMGGDEEHEGIWYPGTLIADHYFTEYAQDLAEDIGAIDQNLTWPYTCIDWDKAARELQYDYSSVEYDGITYWTR